MASLIELNNFGELSTLVYSDQTSRDPSGFGSFSKTNLLDHLDAEVKSAESVQYPRNGISPKIVKRSMAK